MGLSPESCHALLAQAGLLGPAILAQQSSQSSKSGSIVSGKMVEEPGSSEEVDSEAAAHALMDKPFAFEV